MRSWRNFIAHQLLTASAHLRHRSRMQCYAGVRKTALGFLGAVANIYTVWHARKLRRLAATEGKFLPETRLEQRRTFLVLGAAVVSLLAIAFELYAHQFVTHHPWP